MANLATVTTTRAPPAAVAAVSVYLLWIPCRGSMLDGTLFACRKTKGLTDACLRRMDEGIPLVYFSEDVGFAPSASELGGLAMVLAAASRRIRYPCLHDRRVVDG